MRIIAFLHDFRQGHGGAPESIRLLAAELLRFDVVVEAHTSVGVFENVGSLETLPTTAGSRHGHLWSKLRRAQVILVAGPWNRKALLFSLIGRCMGKRLVYMPKGGLASIEFSKNSVRKLFYFYSAEIILLLLADAVILSSRSEWSNSDKVRRLAASKISIIPEIVSFKFGKSPYFRGSACFRVGFLAELAPRKGLAECVEGFLKWAEQNPAVDAELIIAGGTRPGAEKYVSAVKDRVSRSEHCAKVFFSGPLPHEARGAFYASLHVFCAPSKFESFGLTLLEALFAGITVVSGPDVGALEQVVDKARCYVMNNVSALEVSRALSVTFSQRTMPIGEPTSVTLVRSNAEIARDFMYVFLKDILL